MLGFDELPELQGRHGHDAVHSMHPDGSPFPAEDCPVLEPSRTGVPVHRDEDWFIRRDGTMFPVSFTSVPIDLPTGRGIVTTFIDTSAQREAEQSAARARHGIEATRGRGGARRRSGRAGGRSRPPTRRALSSRAICTTARSSSS